MDFGKRVRELRLDRGLTLRQLAEVFHLHYTTINDWEVRGTQPNFETLVAIARFFEVSTDYLLGLEDEYGIKVKLDK